MPLTAFLREIMTVKQSVNKKGEEQLQEVRPAFTTVGFRWALIILIASMHPIGRSILGQMGFVLPDQASEKHLAEEVQQVKSDVGDLKKDIASVRDDMKTTNATVNRLELGFAGFQVDFNKYKNHSQ